jgi:hypothetical protein
VVSCVDIVLFLCFGVQRYYKIGIRTNKRLFFTVLFVHSEKNLNFVGLESYET